MVVNGGKCPTKPVPFLVGRGTQNEEFANRKGRGANFVLPAFAEHSDFRWERLEGKEFIV
jgi:hypothetical protein